LPPKPKQHRNRAGTPIRITATLVFC
jgi:hypothetical protein